MTAPVRADQGSEEQPTLFDDATVTTPTDGAPTEETTLLDRALSGDAAATSDLLTDSPADDTSEDEAETDKGAEVEPSAEVRQHHRRLIQTATETSQDDNNEEPAVEAKDPQRRRFRTAIVAGAAAVASVLVAVGVVSVLSDSGSSEQTTASIPADADINTEAVTPTTVTVSPETTVGTSPEEEFSPTNVDQDKTTGIIHTARVIPGEPVNSAQRPNGDLITIPESRAGGLDNYAITESVVANMAAAMTVEDNQKFLDQLTIVPSSVARIENSWKPVTDAKDQLNHPNFQASIFDDPEDSLILKRSIATDGSDMITLSGGTLYLKAGADFNNKGDWQAPSSHVTDIAPGASAKLFKFEELQIYIITNPDGTRTVRDTYFKLSPVTPTAKTVTGN